MGELLNLSADLAAACEAAKASPMPNGPCMMQGAMRGLVASLGAGLALVALLYIWGAISNTRGRY